MGAFKKTGQGIELSYRLVTLVTALGGMMVGVTAATLRASDKIENATPIIRHDSLVDAVRENKAAIDTLKQNILGLTCWQAAYPSPFCNQVPRLLVQQPQQAGRPR